MSAPTERKKRCKDCEEDKSIEEFYPNARMRDGYFNFCRNCMNLRAKVYRDKYPAVVFRNHAVRNAYAKFGRLCYEIVSRNVEGFPEEMTKAYYKIFNSPSQLLDCTCRTEAEFCPVHSVKVSHD